MASASAMAFRVIAWALVNRLPHPRWRAAGLGWLGARVGTGVRVHPCRLVNFEKGFANLSIGDGVYVGADTLLDLAGPLEIGARATISARCVLITHRDPGQSHGNAVVPHFPPTSLGCSVGADAWLGVGVVVLERGVVGSGSVVGAGGLVCGPLPSGYVCFGRPAKPIRALLGAR